MTRVFTAYGQALALEPRAFGMMLIEPPEPPTAKMLDGGIAIVDVRGPLMHHADPCADSYDAIKGRVAQALADGAKAVVLSVDSPGGLVSGCFDTAGEIRALCDVAGASLVGYVDGCSASAAYGLLCVASRVYVPPAGIVGSIGVLDAVIDETTRDRAMGIGYTLITSGARKADGNSHAPASDAAVASIQGRVNALAGVFFEHVARYRPLDVGAIAALEAGVYVGAEAVTRGLADEVATLDQVVAIIRGGNDSHAAASASTNEVPMTDEEQARAALKAIVEDEKSDDKAKARAKAALAAMDDSEPDGDEKPKEEAKAEGDGEEKPHEEPDGDEGSKAKAVASASLESRIGRIEREQIMSKRSDLSDDQRKALASIPVASLAMALSAIPRAPAKPAALGGSLAATRGAGQGDGGASPTLTPDADLDRAFGTLASVTPIRKDPNNPTRTFYGVLTREQAKAISAKHGGAQ